MNDLRCFFRRRRPSRQGYRPELKEFEPRVLLAVDLLTYHNDSARTGQNLSETILTPGDVNATDFGKLFTDAVDGPVYAQPLYKSSVVVPGQGTHNLVLVATEHDSVYAFDADRPGAPLWQDSFINPAAGITPVPDGDLNSKSIAPEVGITGTPVIDAASNTLYVVAFTREVSGATVSYVQRLHALDVATGAEKFGGPVGIQATLPGSGEGSHNGIVSFDALHENQRPGLLLENGVVYVTWASFDDRRPYHGWVIGYNAQTLHQVAVFNSTPDGGLGGIWQSGAAPAADAAGNIYLITGNGTFDAQSATPPNHDYGDSFLKLSSGSGGLTAADFFTPFNQAILDARDEDLGSGGPLLLPDQPGANPHLLISAGKEGKVYVLNRDNLGGFDPSVDHVVQELPQVITGLFAGPAYWGGLVYFASSGDSLKAFQLANGQLSPHPVLQTSTVFGYPGATPSISANGNSNAIIWVVQNGSTAVLRAYSASDLTTELYDSNQAGSRDLFGTAVKFAAPTVANGKVYVGTQSGLTVFGLLQPLAPPGRQYGPAGSFVAQAYQDLLGRAADPGGLASWSGALNQGVLTRAQVALGIENSLEHQTAEVQGLYSRYLHRSAEPGGLTSWTAFLQAGGTLEQLEASIVGSPEYFQVRGGSSNNGYLTALYQDILGRSVDATGQANWGTALANGMTPAQVAAAVFASSEFLRDLVQGYYQQFLHRTAEDLGLSNWVNALEQGMGDREVMTAFVGSEEYFDRLKR
jgi:hypothetical protein